MSNFELPQKEKKPQVAHTEMKLKVVITEIILKKDKNNQDYWIIRTELDQFTRKSYCAFSDDYNLWPKTKQLLINYPERLVNQWAVLTIRRKNDKEKVISLELEK